MYWLSEYHAAKRTEYNETLSTELTNNRSTDYHEVCTEHKVVSAEYNERAPDEKGTEYDEISTEYDEKTYHKTVTAFHTTGKKLDGDIVECEMRRALGPDGVCLFKVSEFHSKSRATTRVVQSRSANNFPMMPISGQANKQIALLEQGKLPWPLHSSISSTSISTTFAPWPRVDHWTD